MDLNLLQNRLGHEFKDAALLQQALTHRSHSSLHNERLEFLGDSILNCVVASLLFERYTRIDEGDLSRLRANLVKQQSLYEIAQRLELSQFLRLGEGELKSGGFRRPSILADTLEALFGAVFLDAGFDAARRVIRSLYVPILDTVDPKTLGKDAKTLLQEFLQGKKIPLPQYNVVATHGAAHNQQFEIECLVPKLDVQVFGTGGSRRAGEQAAAKLALEAVQTLLAKTPSAARKSKPRTAQLKLAGIATVQPEAPVEHAAPSKPARAPRGEKARDKTTDAVAPNAASTAASTANTQDTAAPTGQEPESAAHAQPQLQQAQQPQTAHAAPAQTEPLQQATLPQPGDAIASQAAPSQAGEGGAVNAALPSASDAADAQASLPAEPDLFEAPLLNQTRTA